MVPLRHNALRGNWATLLLPINRDDSIDYSLLSDEIDRFVDAGVNGIYSNGTAGEFYTQTEAEFDRISQLLAETCERAEVPFQIGASHMSAQLSRERLRRAKTLRPSAFQITLPDWFVPSWSEILAFLAGMQEVAAPVPLVIYNPPHAKRRLGPAEWLAVAEKFPGVVGIKVPGGDAAWYREMQPVFGRLSVFIPGHQLSQGLAQGAHGAYSNVACLSPSGAQRWYRLCVERPQIARLWQEKILSFWMANIAPLITRHGLSNMAADKAAAVAGSWLPGLSPRLRWPYQGASVSLIDPIREAASRELPELVSQDLSPFPP